MANRSFPAEHWIYWVGPSLGASLAAGFFWFIKACDYETANPGQDFDDLEASVYNPEDRRRPSISRGDPTRRVFPNRSDDRPSGSAWTEIRDAQDSTHDEATTTS